MAAQATRPTSRATLRLAAILVVSSLLLAAAILAAATFGLGLRTSYGPGITTLVGNQVVRDFLADQDAEAAALSRSDQALLNNRLSDAALGDVIQQIQNQGGSNPATVAFQPSSITVLRAQDPNDATLLVEVQEDGTKTVTTNAGPNSAPSTSELGFHGNFWLRSNGGRYTIADQDIQTLPTSYVPQFVLVLVAAIWVGLAYVLYRRSRPAPMATELPPTDVGRGLAEPPIEFESFEPTVTQARTVIRTFGGLQVLEHGRDWAPTLSGREVMGFVWRRVFLAVFEDPSASVARDTVATQAYPSVDREYQFGRLRTLIKDGVRDLPEPLRKRIIADPKVLRFDLTDCSVDALELIRLAERFGRLSSVSPAEAATIRKAIDESSGLFLPEFESVDDQVTSGHPTGRELIRGLRDRIAERRAQLVMVLARTYIAGRRPDLAVALLEPAEQSYPSNVQIHGLLTQATRASDQKAAARY